MPTPAQCIERFSEIEISPESREYLRYHACRFSYLIGEVKRAAKARDGAECRILDVGLAYQTTLLRDALPRAIVNSLGYFDERFPARPGEVHFPFDLNEAQYPERCPAPAMKHDVIVMAEVIEHLYTAPRLVLRHLAGWLHDGGVLLLQTPNAVSLAKRLAMLRGLNPFEMIRD